MSLLLSALAGVTERTADGVISKTINGVGTRLTTTINAANKERTVVVPTPSGSV